MQNPLEVTDHIEAFENEEEPDLHITESDITDGPKPGSIVSLQSQKSDSKIQRQSSEPNQSMIINKGSDDLDDDKLLCVTSPALTSENANFVENTEDSGEVAVCSVETAENFQDAEISGEVADSSVEIAENIQDQSPESNSEVSETTDGEMLPIIETPQNTETPQNPDSGDQVYN